MTMVGIHMPLEGEQVLYNKQRGWCAGEVDDASSNRRYVELLRFSLELQTLRMGV